MPPIVSSSGDHFGQTLPHILGTAVSIGAVMADQSASVYGTGIRITDFGCQIYIFIHEIISSCSIQLLKYLILRVL